MRGTMEKGIGLCDAKSPSADGGLARREEMLSTENATLEQRVPGFTLVRRLSCGETAEVFEARRESSDERLAVKVMSRRLSAVPLQRERFLRQAHLASKLQHPNVCRLEDSGSTPTHELYLVMEFIAGESLADRLRRGRLPIETALDVAIQTARGLSSAHQMGIIHRDIKPANLMLTPSGTVKIVDFGVAHFKESTGITEFGQMLGTVLYASPEQIRGQPIDARADLWSLGVVLHEMVTGTFPFKGAGSLEIIGHIVDCHREPVRNDVPEVPFRLEEIIGRALAKRTWLRYRSVDRLCADLEDLQLAVQEESR